METVNNGLKRCLTLMLENVIITFHLIECVVISEIQNETVYLCGLLQNTNEIGLSEEIA